MEVSKHAYSPTKEVEISANPLTSTKGIFAQHLYSETPNTALETIRLMPSSMPKI